MASMRVSGPILPTNIVTMIVILPATDKGLNYSLAKLAGEADTYFRPKAIVDGDIKFEILNVEKDENVRIDGFFVTTLRVNYRAVVCNR